MAKIGILGDGQLGALTAQAAQGMGHDTMVFGEVGKHAPAAQVSPYTQIVYSHACDAVQVVLDYNPDVVTSEWENIPLTLLKSLERDKIPLYPKADVFEKIQHRDTEKQAVIGAGEQVVDYQNIYSKADVQNAFNKFGPGILKTARDGYDSKGQSRTKSQGDVDEVLQEISFEKGTQKIDYIYEQLENFDYEISVIVARNIAGDMRVYEPAHNTHKNGILDTSVIPAWGSDIDISDDIIRKSKQIAQNITEKMGVVGLLTVEMFVGKDGTIKVNELAPRPHNSGHGTIESYNFSQYQSLVQAILGEDFTPLQLEQKTKLKNILGNDIYNPCIHPLGEFNTSQLLNVNMYDYGKRDEGRLKNVWRMFKQGLTGKYESLPPGRKMGHQTAQYPFTYK